MKPGFDDEQIVKSGYRDSSYYFRGMSRFNSSVFGWTGHFGDKESDFTGKGNLFLSFVLCIHLLNLISYTIQSLKFKKDE